MVPFAAVEDRLRNLLHRQVGVGIGLGAEGGTQHQQRALRPHLVGELLELVVGQAGRGHVNEILLRGVAVLPIDRIAGRIGESLQLAQGLRKHGGIVVFVDHPVAPLVLFQQGWRQAVVTESAAPFPVDGLCDAAGILAVDDFFQAGDDVGVAVLAQLHHDPAAAHLVGDSAGGARTGERVEDELAGIGSDFNNTLH